MSLLDQVKNDIATAMKGGDRERVGALRLVSSELQKAHKETTSGDPDEIAVLQRERKRRIEASEAYREAGRDDMAGAAEGGAAPIGAHPPPPRSGGAARRTRRGRGGQTRGTST